MKLLQPSTWPLFQRETEGAVEVLPAVRSGRDLRPPMETLTPDHPAVRATRQLAELSEKLNRTYDAAMSDNYNADFRGTYGAPNSEIVNSQYTINARVRTLAKDTSHGTAVQRTFQNNVVGHHPFPLEMKVGKWVEKPNADGTVKRKFIEETETNDAIQRAWKKFCKKDNFTVRKTMSEMEALRMVEAELVGPGAVLCRLHRDYPFNEFRFAVDFLEIDRLQSTYMGVDKEGNPIRFSISWHPQYNFPLYYHVLTRHPGDFMGGNFQFSPRLAEQVFREQVPADDIILFSNLRNRAEQDMGTTELDSTVQPLWRIHQYEKSLTLTSIAVSARPWWLEKDLPTGLQIPDGMKEQMSNTPGLTGMENVGGTTDVVQQQNGTGVPTNAVKPGEREEFPAGYKLKYADPRFPIEAAHEFRQDNTRDIAVGAGVAYQHVSGDFQNLGFIAGLMCMIPFQENCKVRQHNLKDGGLERIFAEWLKACIQTGYFDRQGVNIEMRRYEEYLEAAHFKGKGFPFVNPLVQAQAIILLCEAGHITRQQAQDMLPDGMSFEKLVQELANERDEMDAHDLPFGQELATEPGINKEGGDAPGTPKPAGVEEGGNADIPPKTKTGLPKSRAGNGRFSRARIAPEVMAMIEHSTNGHH
jgi:capsid protein